MKVQIRDKEALDSLTVANLRAYLEAHGWGDERPGWGDERPWGTWAAILSKEGGGKMCEVSVPNEAGGPLYAESVAEIIATLAEAEDRSQLDVFYDLANPMADAMVSGDQKGANNMANVWCVRADGGQYTDYFVRGGYFGYGSRDWPDFRDCRNRDEVREKLAPRFPPGTSQARIAQYVGMMSCFLLDIHAGDWIITPAADSGMLWCGKVEPGSCSYEPEAPDGCPYPMRRKIVWEKQALRRGSLSMPLQYALRASKTVFAVRHREDFLTAIEQSEELPPSLTEPRSPRTDTHRVVLKQILNLGAEDVEMLVGQLLAALGFESKVVGKSGDGGIDVTGELNVSNLATVNLFVQVKRYQSKKLRARDVRKLQKVIPPSGQGAFITTSDYHPDAWDAASDPAFPRIGLINGHQLVDLLIEHWNDIDPEFREMMGLKPGLVPA